MNILFIGTVEFSKRALQKLIEIDASPVGVITKEYSPFNADFTSLASVCEKHGIRYRFADDINEPETIQWIQKRDPDVIFCFGWSSLLRKTVLNIAPKGVIGFHPASLPQNRGRHPIIWAIALGLTQTASTFFFMDQGADSGDILSQEPVSIDYKDDASSLYGKITETAMHQIEGFVPALSKDTYLGVPQDHQKANTWRKRGKEDGLIDFRMSSRNIYNLVRALTKPYVGAHVEYNGQEVKIWKAREYECSRDNIEPGKILSSSPERLLVKCGDKAIGLIEHEFEKLPQEGEYLK